MIQLTPGQIKTLLDGGEAYVLRTHRRDEFGIAHPPLKCGETRPVHRKPDEEGQPVRPGPERRAAVTRVREIRLGELTDQDAEKAGHSDLDALMAWWVRTRGRWNEQAWAWLLHLMLPPDAPTRLLAPTGSIPGHNKPLPPEQEDRDSPSDHGYTAARSRAMRDEPEAVDDGALALFTSGARVRDGHIQKRREADLDKRPLCGRLELVIATARLKGIDIRDDLRQVERCVRSAERRTHQRAA